MRPPTKSMIKSHLFVSLAALLLFFTARGGFGQSIGIRFWTGGHGSALNPTDIAGVVPTANWNNETVNSGSATALTDSTGAATSVGAVWTSNDIWDSGGNNGFPAGPDQVLMQSYLDGGAGTGSGTGGGVDAVLTVTDLPSSITNGGYTVYVYALGGSANRSGTYTLTNSDGSYSSSLICGPISNPSTYVNGGDYVVFNNVTGSSFTVVADPYQTTDGTYRSPLNGVQIVPNGTPPVVGTVTPVGPNGFSFEITDVGGSTPNTNTLVVKLNGTTVINDGTNSSGTTSVTYAGGVTTVTYSQATRFDSGVAQTVEVIFSGNFTGTVDVSRTFTVYYSNDPFAASIGLQFGVDFYGLPLAPSDEAGVVPEYNWNPLAGNNSSVTNVTDSTGANIPVSVSWSANDLWGAGPAGNNGFPAGPNNTLMADYLDGGSGGVDAIVSVSGLPSSITSGGYRVYLYMLGDSASPQGQYTVQDSNGYDLTLNANGMSSSSAFADATFFLGNHGNYLEFDGLTGSSFSVDATPAPGNTRSPLNAVQIVPNNPVAPTTSPVFPIGANSFGLNIVNLGSVGPELNTLVVKLDGTNVSGGNLSVNQSEVSVYTNASVYVTNTAVIYSLGGSLTNVFGSGSTHTVEVSFTVNPTGTVDVTNSFVAPTYTPLPIGLWTPPGSGNASEPGFKWQVWQASDNLIYDWQGWQDYVEFDEQQIAGLMNTNTAAGAYGTNVANLTQFTDNGWYDDTNVVNDSFNGENFFLFTPSYGYTPAALPGLPGIEGNYGDVVYQIITFLQFPTNGFYSLGLENDNGVKLTVGDRTGPDIGVRVLAPASVAGAVDAVPTVAGVQGGTCGGPLPTTPIIARAVLCNPLDPLPNTLPNNASALSNNIALIELSNYFTDGEIAADFLSAQEAGAVAIVCFDTGYGGSMTTTITYGGTANVTIPVEEIDAVEGMNIFAQATADANSPVIMSVGDDSSPNLGESPYGSKAYNVLVPKAGLYPFRVLFESDGGDGYLAWYATDVNGNFLLVNDLTGPFTTNTWAPAVTLNAYRARSVTTGAAQLNAPAVSGSNVMISWTGEGELEQAFSLSGPWTKSTYQNNPALVPMNNLITTTFFRVRQY